MTKPLRDQKLIFVWDNGVDVFEKLTRKEIQNYEIMTPDEKLSFIEEHEKDSIFYPNETVYYLDGNCEFDDDKPELKEEEYFNDLHEYILDNWKDKGTVTDEENAQFNIETITYLLSNYRLKCLISTIIDIEDLWEKFDEEN